MFVTKIAVCLLLLLVTTESAHHHKKGCNFVPNFRLPDDGNAYVIYGFTIDNTRLDGSEASDTAPFTASVNGVVCARTDAPIDATSRPKKFSCPKPLVGEYLDISAKHHDLFICNVIVEGHRDCGHNRKYDAHTNDCVCKYGSHDGHCRASDPCGKHSELGDDGECVCHHGRSLDGRTCISNRHDCPANSELISGRCQCRAGYAVNGNSCHDPCGSLRKLVNGQCTCTIGVSVDGHSCVSGAHGCPAHSDFSHGRCQCHQGYAVKANSCFDACGAHRHIENGQCTCKTFGLDGHTCVGDCPSHSHRGHSNRCVCNDGYVDKHHSCHRKLDTCDGIAYTYCHRSGDCLWHDIRHFHASVQECQTQCSKDCNCKSIQARGHDCWLKNHVCSRHQLSHGFLFGFGHNLHDYVKLTPGQSCPH